MRYGKTLILAALLCLPGLLAAGRNLIPNGSLDEPAPDGKTPAGWTPMGNFEYLSKDGNRWVRFINGGRIKIAVPVPQGARFMRVAARMRARDLKIGTASWHNARVIVRVFDNKTDKPHYRSSPALKEDSDWRLVETYFELPQGAKMIDLEPGMFECKGVFEVDDVVVEVMDSIPVENAQLPEGFELHWGEEPVVERSPARAEIVLNGVWKFIPAVGEAEVNPTRGWGYVRVPSCWMHHWNRNDQWIARPQGGPWEGFGAGRSLAKAWYERPLFVPEAWRGRAVLVDMQRVSTDADVYVNGQACGRVSWPFGAVDITKAVRFGKENALRILVVAVPDEGEVQVIMGPNQISTREASLSTRGIVGDVTLRSRPRGAHVSDVFVQPSVRRKEIALGVELRDVAQAGEARFVARMLDEKGNEEKRFEHTAKLAAADSQSVDMAWGWEDPRLWDYRRPDLYTLQLEVRGAGIEDVYPQAFGFRELWIEGKRFMLNGSEFRMRPDQGEGYWPNSEALAEAMMEGRLAMGFNVHEFWPNNHNERGSDFAHRELWARVADRKGYPIIGCAMSMSGMVGAHWNDPDRRKAWQQRMEAELRRYRNHPSIIMWVHSGNRFGHRDDQNPLRIGVRSWDDLPDYWREIASQGNEATEMIRRADPTRPVMSHQCGPVGDVYSLNNYLCFIPLQEREEWLSHWAQEGDMPYMAVEFGTPLDSSLSRSRAGGNKAGGDEILPTEYGAIYLGRDSYEMESPGLRANLAALNKDYREREASGEGIREAWHWNYRQLCRDGVRCLAFEALQEIFIPATWRSWRTWGITGGMVPWGFHRIGFDVADFRSEVEAAPFVPGTRGAYYTRYRLASIHYMQEKGSKARKPAGEAMQRVNGDTLAYIAGPEEAWTAKDHHFWGGDAIEKQVVLINDGRQPADFSYTLSLELNGKMIDTRKGAGRLEVGRILMEEWQFDLPDTEKRINGVLRLRATIAEHKHEHDFPMRVYPAVASRPVEGFVYVFDPEGDTARILEDDLDQEVREWKGEIREGAVLVVGRRALSLGKLPGELEDFVAQGGRLAIHAQEPGYLRDVLGLRVSAHVGRRAWPVATQRDHPIVKGLDGEDFRDWNGKGTLVAERPTGLKDPMAKDASAYGNGWRWGNRGAVSSAIVEKPHYSGWTPILEGEFDLAFSSLMELRYGKGLAILNTLDVEEREGEPMAAEIVSRILRYAAQADAAPRRPAVCIGIGEAHGFLGQAGVECETSDALPDTDCVAILGPEAKMDVRDLENFVREGGRIVMLPGRREDLPFGLRTREAHGRYAALPVSQEGRGLGASDVHLRFDVPFQTVEGPGTVRFGDGLVAVCRPQGARGAIWFVGILPDDLKTEENFYLRYSTWRVARAISQLLTNAGVGFSSDAKVFLTTESAMRPQLLSGPWRWRVEKRTLYAQGQGLDSGIAPEAREWATADASGEEWSDIELPGYWDETADLFDGAVWFRRQADLPESWRGKDLVLEMGAIDDFDVTWCNGREIGRTGAETPKFYAHPRSYIVPGELTRTGTCVFAVRVWDHFGSGGFAAESPGVMRLFPRGRGDEAIAMAGLWKYRIESKLEPAQSYSRPLKDPGVSDEAKAWSRADLDDSDWQAMRLPQYFEIGVGDFDGAAWFRREVQLPEALAGRELQLRLGPIATSDTVFFNGQKIGATQDPSADRVYSVPGKIVRAGANRIAVRVFDAGGKGGFAGQPDQMLLQVPGTAATALWYTPGYREDHARGDSYTRYYRW